MPSKTPLLEYLRLQKALDTEVLSSLRAAAASADAELRRLQARTGIGSEMRQAQVVASQAEINRQMAQHWERVGNATAAAQANAAADAAEAVFRASPALSSVFDPKDLDYMARSVRTTASQNVATAMERVSGSSYVPLAESVYDNAALTSGKIDEIVTSALARGASAAELARDVKGFINPETPGGVRYASERLARTELNNAFHAGQIREAQAQPWTDVMLWNLSGSHPKPDECNVYAEQTHFVGGKMGQFRPDEVPAKPHPNCLCFMTTEDIGRDEFIRRFESGELDTYLDETFPDLPAVDAIKLSPQKAVREYAWGNGDNGQLVYVEINSKLRNGEALSGRAEAVAQGLDKAFTLVKPLPRPTTVYRQFPGQDEALVKDLLDHARTRRVWTDKGFMSTTKTTDILEDFDNAGTGVRVNIRVPGGSRVVHVDDYLDEMDFRQDEWLLPRGTKLTFGKPRRDGDGWVIDAHIGDTPVKPIREAISPATKIAQLETLISSEQARARKNPRLRPATQENIRKARVEINKLRKRR